MAFCGFEVIAPAPKPLKYPKTLKALSDHIKKRRMDLGLLQADVARIIGVSTDSVTYWETGRAIPQIQYMPAIILFLGYNPIPSDITTLAGRIKEYRVVHGLSCKELGGLLNVDASTVSSWESGKFQPQVETKRKLKILYAK